VEIIQMSSLGSSSNSELICADSEIPQDSSNF